MKELSLYILDVAQNSISAGATRLELTLTEDALGWLTVVIADYGCGMDPEFLSRVTDPFTTTRTTRKVGMGLALYLLAAQQTGGTLHMDSAPGQGTTVTATFDRSHLDCPPLGDLAGTVALLIQGSPALSLRYRHTTPWGEAELSTEELKAVLGEEISLAEPEIFTWIQNNLSQQEAQLEGAAQSYEKPGRTQSHS